MNIEHRTTPIEHWIVDGKAYRLATEADVGKEVDRTDVENGVREAINPISGTVPLTAYEPEHKSPYVCACRWKYAYIQDDSLLAPQDDTEIEPGPTAEAKPIDWMKPVRTKTHKKPVRIVCTDGPGEYPVIGIVENDVDFWDLQGNLADDAEGYWSLENAPQRMQREYWVNVYPGTEIASLHYTKERADSVISRTRLACVKIAIDCEEGEGL